MTKQRINPKQEAAIDLVMVGFSDGEIAKQVGVGRQRVNMWRNQNEDFRTVLAERRKALCGVGEGIIPKTVR